MTIKTPAFVTDGTKIIPINLYDTLTLEAISERKIHILKKSGYKIPTNDKNPVYRIAVALQKRKPTKFGVKIRIEKNTPTFSGLHSQLSNAAGTLIALNQLWKFNLPEKELLKIARLIDPKIPRLLTALLKPNPDPRNILLIRPKHIVINAGWSKKHNPLSYFPDLKAIIKILKEHGAEKSGLNGGGPMVFGWFKGAIDIKPFKKIINKKTDFIWAGSSCNKGVELIH
ncbi:hypothetical protein KKA33_03180 [Patescibacteria group bacterium]|nr:hypothetical protein [Patescibacteria group bacterium]